MARMGASDRFEEVVAGLNVADELTAQGAVPFHETALSPDENRGRSQS